MTNSAEFLAEFLAFMTNSAESCRQTSLVQEGIVTCRCHTKWPDPAKLLAVPHLTCITGCMCE